MALAQFFAMVKLLCSFVISMPVQISAGDCLRSLESSGAQTLTPASKISGPLSRYLREQPLDLICLVWVLHRLRPELTGAELRGISL